MLVKMESRDEDPVIAEEEENLIANPSIAIYLEEDEDIKPDVSNIPCGVVPDCLLGGDEEEDPLCNSYYNDVKNETFDDDFTFKHVNIDYERSSGSNFEKMAGKSCLSSDEILAFHSSIPSDYEEDTDDSADEEFPLTRLDLSQTIIQISDIADQPNAMRMEDLELQENSDINIGNCSNKRIWVKKPEPFTDSNFTKLPKKVINCATPLDAFFEFIDEDMFDRFHFQTNWKSVQKGKPASVTKDEIKIFLGINLIMGYHSVPSIQHYWSNHEDLKVLAIQKAMSRDRFQTILSNFHMIDNRLMDPNNRDKLYKVRPFLDHLNEVFFRNRSLSEYLCIDESVIRFKGKRSLKQHNSMKSIRQGYKLWCLADDSGYIYKTSVYIGKQEYNNSEEIKLYGHGGQVVNSLLSTVTEKNHKVFFDSYFSSIPLMEKLKQEQILACGIIRNSGNDFPQLTSDTQMNKGDTDYRSTATGITVFKWMDSKAVHLISNYHNVSYSKVERKDKRGIKEIVTCPSVVRDYNKHIGGVGKHEMLKQSCGNERKCSKWWHRLFFGLLDMAIINAYILYNENRQGKDRISAFDFYRDIATGLLTFSHRVSRGPVKRRKLNYSTSASIRLSNVGAHLPIFVKEKNRCEVCSVSGIVSRPMSKCRLCGVHLCCNASKNCFIIYHNY